MCACSELGGDYCLSCTLLCFHAVLSMDCPVKANVSTSKASFGIVREPFCYTVCLDTTTVLASSLRSISCSSSNIGNNCNLSTVYTLQLTHYKDIMDLRSAYWQKTDSKHKEPLHPPQKETKALGSIQSRLSMLSLRGSKQQG